MIREQRIVKRIIDEIGDDLNEYISTFNGSDLWTIKEGELIVNKTFKRLINIIADFNLTTSDKILANAYEMADDPRLNMMVIERLCEDYIIKGGGSILNRTMSLCYLLWYITHVSDKGIKTSDVLYNLIDSELLFKKESIWQNIKYKLGFAPYPYKIICNPRALSIITLLNGKPLYNTIQYIAEYNELM